MIKVIAFDYAGVIEIAEKNIIEEITDYLQITKEQWGLVYYSLTLNYETPQTHIFILN